MKKILAALAALMLTTACTPEVTEAAPIATPEIDPADEGMTRIMDMVWYDMPAEDQETLCLGWYVDKDAMLDAFMDGEMGVSRQTVEAYFNGKCD